MVVVALRDLLFAPARFFAERDLEDLRVPAAAVIVASLLLASAGTRLLRRMALGPDRPGLAGAVTPEFVLAVGLMTGFGLFLWLLLVGVVYLAIGWTGPDVTFAGTFTILGIGAVLQLPVIALFLLDVALSLDSVSTLGEFHVAVSRDPVKNLLAAAATLWTGYIWREGFRVGHDVGRRRATLVAGGLVALSLLRLLL